MLASGNVTIRPAQIVVLLLLLAGCRRQLGPDENYEKALKLYQQLYGTQLDDAYGDPRMDTVVTQLKLVDKRSIDAPQAERMLESISHGREELAKTRAAREKMAAAAEAAARKPINIDPARILATEAAAQTARAGAAADPYAAGSSVADINTATGGCLVDGEPFEETGGSSQKGTVYRLAGAQQCREKLPAFVGQAVLVTNGRIYRRIPDVTPTVVHAARPDGGAQQAPVAQPAPAK